MGASNDLPRIPRLLGLVTSSDKIMGILEEFVDGENLSKLDMREFSTEQQRNWKMKIGSAVRLLHENGFV